jgi:hypothetical protein
MRLRTPRPIDPVEVRGSENISQNANPSMIKKASASTSAVRVTVGFLAMKAAKPSRMKGDARRSQNMSYPIMVCKA